jgi:multidrug efflux pump
LNGTVQASEDISFRDMRRKLNEDVAIIKSDPAVDTVTGYTGGNRAVDIASLNVTLKPLSQRKLSASRVIDRLRPQLAQVPGAMLYLQAIQDVQIGGRRTNAQFQYTLQGDNEQDLLDYALQVERKLQALPQLRDVSSDLQNRGLEAALIIDRDTASRLGITPEVIDNALYDAFGQRQVSTMFKGINQYHVVMEVASEFQQNPEALKYIYVHSSTGQAVPLDAFTHYEPSTTALAVAHQGQFPAVTISVQSGSQGASWSCRNSHRESAAHAGFAIDNSPKLSGYRIGLSILPNDRAVSHPRCFGDSLHRGGNPL